MKKPVVKKQKKPLHVCHKCRRVFPSAFTLHHHKCNPIRRA